MKNKLKELREERELSQEELCKQIKSCGLYISRSAYSKYETGSREFSCETLCAFADFFETTTDEILMRKAGVSARKGNKKPR